MDRPGAMDGAMDGGNAVDGGCIEIEPLTGRHDLAPLLAGWHHAEFGQLYDPAVWDHASAVAEFEAMAHPEAGDATWVAYAGPGRTHDDVLGSASLVATDDLPGCEHLSPWLASLYVSDAARSRGVGSMLVDTVIAGAAERGHRYVHLFTAGQEEYYLARGWRSLLSVEQRGQAATVMVRATSRHGARRAVTSQWCANPDTQGAYSYLRPGGTPADRDVLAGPILPGLWLAGEACSRAYPATMHGAWFSGEHAAEQVIAADRGADVLVIGAGLSGIASAQRLRRDGRRVTVLEATDRAGGRAATDVSLGMPLPLGGAWLHGDVGHPLAPHVRTFNEPWSDLSPTYVVGHGRVDDADIAAAMAARPRIDQRFAESRPGDDAASVLDAALAAETALTDIQRRVIEGFVTREIENLFAAPIADFAADTGFEPYALPGDDCLIVSSLADAVAALSDGIDIVFGERVAGVRREGDLWHTDSGRSATDMIVAVPIAAVQAGRIEFDPPLPPPVRQAMGRIGTGPVTKLFATYDTAWWPSERPIRVIGADLLLAVDMQPLTGAPVLCWFATGDAARRIELLNEDECCRLVDDVAASCGLA